MKTVYQDDNVIVRVNDSGEVFVKNKSNTELRISPAKDHLDITAYGCNYIPKSFTGLPGFRVK